MNLRRPCLLALALAGVACTPTVPTDDLALWLAQERRAAPTSLKPPPPPPPALPPVTPGLAALHDPFQPPTSGRSRVPGAGR